MHSANARISRRNGCEHLPYWTSRMSRCSEQKQQMEWEPLPLPVGDESPLCFSTTENHPPLETRRWMMQVFSLAPRTASTVRKTTPPSSLMPPRRCLGWGKDKLALSDPVRNWVWPITKPLTVFFFTHIFAHPWRLSKDRRLASPAPDRTAAAAATLTLASRGFGARFFFPPPPAAISLSSKRCWYG